ncbi:hypothetical protein T4B_13196 [Trichinella pseudospiralis]|uniref:Secreted protein n=1 Tax=Trichinella pseudospiralis TaxID=6337 RepID=A0A0V1HJV9_TRIPS|nr:hypothetical protein T4B_13196 [Trichinella pseudospiralis]
MLLRVRIANLILECVSAAFSTSYIPFDLCDPHSPASSACPAIIRARARALLFLKLLRYFNQCSQRFFLISHPGFVTILPGAHPSHGRAPLSSRPAAPST